MNLGFSLLFYSLLTLTESKIRKNYCDPRLCQNPLDKNTACRNTASFAPNCASDIKLIKLTSKLKFLITDIHNYYRSVVSYGTLEKYTDNSSEFFPPARRMLKLSYNEEHAILAGLHLKTCQSHDACRNTYFNETSEKVVLVGQNIAFFYTYGERESDAYYLENSITNWFNEYRETPLSIIDSVNFNTKYTIGHFTQLAYDQNDCVGCSMAQWTEENGQKKVTRVTCNYCKSHIGNKPVYIKSTSGIACDDCTTCDDTDYPSICLD